MRKIFEHFLVIELALSKAKVSYCWPAGSCKFQEELCEFCEPLLQPTNNDTKQTTINTKEEMQNPQNSFIFFLQHESAEYYAVCVRSEELNAVAPSFAINWEHGESKNKISNIQQIYRCYCIISSEPIIEQHFSVLFTLLTQEGIYRMLFTNQIMTGEITAEEEEAVKQFGIDIIEDYYSISFPKTGEAKIRLAEGNQSSCTITLASDDSATILRNWVIPLLFRILSLKEIASLHSALLQEISIIVKSSSPGLISIVILAVNILLYPLKWQGPLLTLLPPSLREYLDSPVPIVLGVHSDCFRDEIFHHEYFVLDLDSQNHQIPPQLIKNSEVNTILSKLHKIEVLSSGTTLYQSSKLQSLSITDLQPQASQKCIQAIQQYTQQTLDSFKTQITKHGDQVKAYDWDSLKISTCKLPMLKRVTQSQHFAVYAEGLRRESSHKLYQVSVLKAKISNLHRHLEETANQLEQEIIAKQLQLEKVKSHISALDLSQLEVSESLAQLSADKLSELEMDHWEDTINQLSEYHSFHSEDNTSEYFRNPQPFTAHEIDILTTNAVINNYSVGDEVYFDCDSFYFIKSGLIILRENRDTFGLLEKNDIFCSSNLFSMKGVQLYAQEESFVCDLNSLVMASIFESDADLLSKCFSLIARRLAQWIDGIIKEKNYTFSPTSRKNEHRRRTDLIKVKVEIQQRDSSCKKMLQLTSQATVGDLYNKCSTFPQCMNRKFVLQTNYEGDVTKLDDQQQVLLSLITDITRPIEVALHFLESQQVVVKQYECNFGGNGVLILSQSEAIHYSSTFGIEKKRIIFYSKISQIVHKKGTTLLIQMGSKIHKLKFNSETDASDVFRVIKVLQESSPQASRGAKVNTVLGRAVVVKPFIAIDPAHLSLSKDQVIIISKKISPKRPDYWYGGYGGCFGWFPKDCVKMHFEPELNKQLLRDSDSSSCLRNLPTESDWKLILKGSCIVKRDKGEYIVKEGEYFDGLYQILKGECTVLRPGPSPTIQTQVAKIKTDEIFGEITLLTGSGSKYTVVASQDCELYALSSSYMEYVFKNNPIVAGRFFSYLCCILESRLAQNLSSH